MDWVSADSYTIQADGTRMVRLLLPVNVFHDGGTYNMRSVFILASLRHRGY